METEKKALKKEVFSLKKAVRNAEEEIADLNDDLDGFKNNLGAAINQIDDLEQYTRKHNLEIHGISESSAPKLNPQKKKYANEVTGRLNLPVA